MSKERSNPQPSSQDDGVEQEELDAIEYLQKLNDHLSKKTKMLSKSCEALRAQISHSEEMTPRYLRKVMETMPGCSSYIDTVKTRLDECLADFIATFNAIKVEEKDYYEFLSKCRSEFKARLDADVCRDEYTMMSYHEVEAEIHRIQTLRETTANKTLEVIQRTNMQVLESDSEHKELLQLNDDLEGYLAESQREKVQLNTNLSNKRLQNYKQTIRN